MKKIPTLFQRDPDNPKRVIQDVNPEAAWVLNGEGKATRKYDGTCCLIRDGKLYKRYELREGKTAPDGFEPADERIDWAGQIRIPGWVPVRDDDPNSKYHLEAFTQSKYRFADGTYELVGPKIQGNPENSPVHVLWPHAGALVFEDAPRNFDDLREYLSDFAHEGIVWHHPDGRMAKIKRKDFHDR